MVINLAECSRLEQRYVIKSLVAENCKPYEIYRRICDVSRQACFIQKHCLQMGKTWLYHYKPVSKRQSMEWKHIDSPVKKTFQALKSVKKVLLIVF